MKIIGLDGEVYHLNISKNSHARGVVSSHHARARDLLVGLYPLELVFEEVTLPGSKTLMGKNLVVDFYLPGKSLMVEVHGEQHYKFVEHFHGNKLEFARAKMRDKNKREWCELNGVVLVEFPYNEDNEEWLKRLNQS